MKLGVALINDGMQNEQIPIESLNTISNFIAKTCNLRAVLFMAKKVVSIK